MRTTTKTLIAAVSVLALLGVGVAAAQTPDTTTDSGAPASDQPVHQGWLAKLRAHLRFFHRHPVQAMDKVCDGNITVNECKDLLKQKVQDAKAKVQQAAQAKYETCLESRSQDYCDGRLDQFKADHPGVYGNQTADPASA